MKTFRIAVDYSVCGVIKIKAKNLKEAIKLISLHGQINDVKDKEYIDDSFNVNEEMSEYFAKEDKI